MPLRTTAVDAAAARGWSKKELADKTGLSLSLIYQLAAGAQPGAKAIGAIMGVFPDLPFERLFIPVGIEPPPFVPANSSMVHRVSSKEDAELVA